ncbi:MAG: riboflavin biosynthesis protein RibF [Oligoflexia bacterium]|nr:riboflavin biosynthesis protein RibF [Oligoflexia bacterium]
MRVIQEHNILLHQNIDSSLQSQQWGLVIGNFDGVHLGHQHYLQHVQRGCEALGIGILLLTFRPHTYLAIKGPIHNFLLNSYEEKILQMQELTDKGIIKIDCLLEIAFDKDVRCFRYEEFVTKVLLSRINIKKMFFGYDFAIGVNRNGSLDSLKKHLQQKKILYEEITLFSRGTTIYSSSKVREYINKGDLAAANKILGREFYLSGVVVKKKQLGGKIGIPTANVAIDEVRAIPKSGVYVTLFEYAGKKYPSVTSVGTNPTVESTLDIKIETHIFDFHQDIYDKNVSVHFIDWIREEKKFTSIDELIKIISSDIAIAKKYFLNQSPIINS